MASISNKVKRDWIAGTREKMIDTIYAEMKKKYVVRAHEH